MILPTIHLNGSSPTALLEQYVAAIDALRDALRALESIDINGRDYYPQGEGAIRKALAEHSVMCANVKKYAIDLNKVAEHISSFC